MCIHMPKDVTDRDGAREEERGHPHFAKPRAFRTQQSPLRQNGRWGCAQPSKERERERERNHVRVGMMPGVLTDPFARERERDRQTEMCVCV